MSEPEIARRCPSCGASIRMRGLFCPQCGKPVSERQTNSDENNEPETAEILEASETAPIDFSGMTPGATAASREATAPVNIGSETMPLTPRTTDGEIPIFRAQPEATAPQLSSAAADQPVAPATPARAPTAHHAIEGNVMKRAGKLREITAVVFEETNYDPSLRFLIVAAVLFILFLIIVMMSEMLR